MVQLPTSVDMVNQVAKNHILEHAPDDRGDFVVLHDPNWSLQFFLGFGDKKHLAPIQMKLSRFLGCLFDYLKGCHFETPKFGAS